MKKIYFLLLGLSFGFGINAQIINIPSTYFKTALLNASPSYNIAKNLAGNYFKIDANSDNEIQVSEALNVSYLDVNNLYIGDMTGVASFVNLSYLICNNNLISNLDVSTLASLVYLNCAANSIQNLNLSNNTALTNIICNNNILLDLDLTNNTALLNLNCASNTSMTSLNVSACAALQTLNCLDNDLQSLDVSNKLYLTTLDCSYNSLTNFLNVTGCTNLTHLTCSNSLLSALNISSNSALRQLRCDYNYLTNTLDASNNKFLNTLVCGHNQLSTLLLKNGSNETSLYLEYNPNLTYICADESQLLSVQSVVNSAGYAATCQVNSYCSFNPGGTFYLIQGYTKYDGNNNGCTLSDLDFPNLKFNVSNGATIGSFISNDTANYSIAVSSGTNVITPVLENPSYFNLSPATTSVTFPTTTSPFTQHFCATKNGNHSDLEITFIPLSAATPSSTNQALYKIIYKNKGTGTQSGVVNLTFDDTKMDLVSATPTNSSASTNSLSWAFLNLQPFENREIFVFMNINSPTETSAVNAGDILNYIATVTGATDETPNDNAFVLHQTVVNSFDPNDKTCLEGNTITPEMVGKEVHYMIRFENTGTANAENIVVKDMIDTTKFDINSLIPIDGSHSFVTKISGTNKVEFIFENINLPFDNANNDGYVAFKIKTKPSLVLGNTFSNTANIYFDYNFPIITNTATTTVSLLANQDFNFESYFKLYPNPASTILNIETKKTIKVTSINIYNALGQLVLVIPNAQQTKTIDVSSLKTGNYFLKINSDKGSSSVKFVKM